MSTPTTWAPPVGRSDREVFADPSTPESYVIASLLLTRNQLDGAAARPGKSPDLVSAILKRVVAFMASPDYCVQLLTGLLREPNLLPSALGSMSRIAVGTLNGEVLTAVCCHRHTSEHIRIESIWSFGDLAGPVAAAVARATGTLAPIATRWVYAQAGRSPEVGWAYFSPSINQRALIDKTTARWDAAAANNPDLVAFLIASHDQFTNEAELFAAASALAASPTGPLAAR